MPFASFIRGIRIALEFFMMRAPLISTGVVVSILIILYILHVFFCPSVGFPKGALVTVPEDATFGEVAMMLEDKRIVSSSFLLRGIARLSGSDREIDAGRYLFEKPENVISVLGRLSRGEHGLPSVRVTFPEGTSVREMGVILEKALAGFSQDEWYLATRDLEGYLFPDTYDFYKDASLDEVITRMRENFDERTEELRGRASLQGFNFEDIVIMASIIEKEANTEEDRHIVSGILWSRIEEGVALQVDAVFPYIRGNPDHVPTGDDPELDSPYNTYLHRGLPPGPITNPGFDALDAALYPTPTNYFYYLTGKDGKMYYALTFEEHKKNRELYLD